MRLSIAAIIICCTLALSTGSVRAAGAGQEISVTLRDGKVVRGRLVEESQRGYLIALPDRTVLIDYAQVSRVDRTGPAPFAPAPAAEPETATLPFALGGGVLYGPTLYERDQQRFFEVGPVVQLAIEAAGGHLRVAPTFTLGFSGGSNGAVWRKFGELTCDVQWRGQLTESISFGIGGFIGAGLSSSGLSDVRAVGAYAVGGPSVTPISFRFGEAKQHELQLWIALAITGGNGSSGVEAVRPVASYLHHF